LFSDADTGFAGRAGDENIHDYDPCYTCRGKTARRAAFAQRAALYSSDNSLWAASSEDAGFWPVTSLPSVTTKDAQSSPFL